MPRSKGKRRHNGEDTNKREAADGPNTKKARGYNRVPFRSLISGNYLLSCASVG